MTRLSHDLELCWQARQQGWEIRKTLWHLADGRQILSRTVLTRQKLREMPYRRNTDDHRDLAEIEVPLGRPIQEGPALRRRQ